MTSSDDPFEGLPPELRAMIEQLGGANLIGQIRSMFLDVPTGPVNWELATSAANQQAAHDDRQPTDAERARFEQALGIAELWLDDSTLPSSAGGRLVVSSRQEWVNAATTSMRPLVEPVAAAATRSLGQLASEQMEHVDLELGELGELFEGLDLGAMLRPMGATLLGLQTGQVLGQLSLQLLGQYDLGLATAPRATAWVIAPNVEEAFGGWDLDDTEVAIALMLNEGAFRRLYHAVPWLEAHLQGLVAQFANGIQIDADHLESVARELMGDVDPDDPESLQAAMQRAQAFRLEPTEQQRRVLERIQGIVGLVGAWARQEVARAAADRLPNLPRINEILRRRRAVKGDGEQLLAQLLGLDLRPTDEAPGEAFVAAVEEARGAAGLRRALAHPENLPDRDELADPSRWLLRLAGGESIPDDPSSMFIGEAPIEPSAEERLAGDAAEEGSARPDADRGDGDEDLPDADVEDPREDEK
ncbi:MAG: zinc-dependent metalloprotease [Nitriliruptorales bacterium]|nr:zinc-dependent metalloprotease [Nitriliruptorales bacterium]